MDSGFAHVIEDQSQFPNNFAQVFISFKSMTKSNFELVIFLIHISIAFYFINAYKFFQEIIGGILNLDARLWRRPRKIHNPIPKVKQFADWWKLFDFSQ